MMFPRNMVRRFVARWLGFAPVAGRAESNGCADLRNAASGNAGDASSLGASIAAGIAALFVRNAVNL